MPPAFGLKVPGAGVLHVHRRSGGAPPLVLLHGFTDCAESYRLLLPHLGDCALMLPDLRGHGQSFRSEMMSLDALAADVALALDALDLSGAVVVGHSMGALAALRLVAIAPERIAGLVLISGSLRPSGPSLTRLAEKIRTLPDPVPAGHDFFADWHQTERPVPASFLSRLATSAAAMRRCDWNACIEALGDADLRHEARGFHRPALILSGGRDAIFPARHHQMLAATLRDARHISFAGLGHNPHWEAPAEVAVPILDFCRDLRARSEVAGA